MALQLRYQVPALGLADAYEEVGVAQDAQRQAEIARQQSNLDRQFEQQSLQGDRDIKLRYDLAALQNQQQNRQLGAGMYQFDAQRQDRAALAEMDMASRFQQELMRQNGFADMREADAELQDQRLTADLTKEQMRIKQHYQDREFNQAMAAAKMIEEQRQTMSPEMYDQARQQWDQRYGQTAGEYPLMGPGAPQNAPEQIASIRQSLQTDMGDGYYEGAEKDFLELTPPERLDFKAKMAKEKALASKAEADARIRQSESQYDMHRQAIVDDQEAKAKERLNILDIQNQQQALEIKARAEQLKVIGGKIKTTQDAIVAERTNYEKPDEKVLGQLNSDLQVALKELAELSSAPTSVNLLGGQSPQQGGQGSSKDNPIPVTTIQEASALPPGTWFRNPQGETRQRK